MAAESVTAEIERRAAAAAEQSRESPDVHPERSPPPFKTGDIVSLKSGGFAMTVVDCTWVQPCCGPGACWLVDVVYAGWDADKGLLYDELDAELLRFSQPGRLHSPVDDMPF